MNVRDEIEKFASEEHTEAQSYQTNRVWSPTEEGLAIHNYMHRVVTT